MNGRMSDVNEPWKRIISTRQLFPTTKPLSCFAWLSNVGMNLTLSGWQLFEPSFMLEAHIEEDISLGPSQAGNQQGIVIVAVKGVGSHRTNLPHKVLSVFSFFKLLHPCWHCYFQDVSFSSTKFECWMMSSFDMICVTFYTLPLPLSLCDLWVCP